MKQLTNRERNRRKYLKMYKSVENKMHGNNLIWWNSISMKARYHFVFQWNSREDRKSKFKNFLEQYIPKYRVNLSNRRNAIIEHFLD
jgi:hypothetical protein